MTLNSDHLPIIVNLEGWFTSPPKSTGHSCYSNNRKANQTLFTQETEQDFISLQTPTSAMAGWKTLRKILQITTKRKTPRGKSPDFNPVFSQRGLKLMQQLDTRRTQDHTNPQLALKDEQIRTKNYKNNREECRKELASCSIKRLSMRLRRVMKP